MTWNRRHLVAGEVNVFDSGAGSRVGPAKMTERSKFARGCSGFTTVSLRAGEMEVRMIDNKGKMIYATIVGRA